MLFPNLYEFMSYIEHKRDILMNVGYQTVDSSTFHRRNRKITIMDTCSRFMKKGRTNATEANSTDFVSSM